MFPRTWTKYHAVPRCYTSTCNGSGELGDLHANLDAMCRVATRPKRCHLVTIGRSPGTRLKLTTLSSHLRVLALGAIVMAVRRLSLRRLSRRAWTSPLGVVKALGGAPRSPNLGRT